MCDKVIKENGGMLGFIPDCYKDDKTCDKAVDNYSHVLRSDPNFYKTQKLCNKTVDTCPSAIHNTACS